MPLSMKTAVVLLLFALGCESPQQEPRAKSITDPDCAELNRRTAAALADVGVNGTWHEFNQALEIENRKGCARDPKVQAALDAMAEWALHGM